MQGSDLEVFGGTAVARLVQEFCKAIRAREIPTFLRVRVEHRGTPDARAARVGLEPDPHNVRVVVHGVSFEILAYCLVIVNSQLPKPELSSPLTFCVLLTKAFKLNSNEAAEGTVSPAG